MWVILSASVACEAANEAVVAENVRTVSMRARKSLVERVIYCGGCVEVLGPAISDRTVGMEPEVCGEAEGIGACGMKLELLEQWQVELKRLEGILVKLGLEAPQRAQL